MATPDPATDSGAKAAATGTPDAVVAEAEREEIARLERKLGVRTYAGAAAVILALAAAIVAVVLAIDARDNSATDADLSRVERALGGVADDASSFADAQEDIDALSGRVDALEDELGALASADRDVQGRVDVVEDDIEDLRQEIAGLGTAADETGTGGSAPPDEGE